MMGVAIRNIERADAATVAALGQFGVATLHEAMGRAGLMRPDLRPAWPGAALCGSAITVLAPPGDNWMLHVAAEMIREGDVVVAALTSENSDGMFGELLATSYHARGGRGLVIDAGCRDVKELQAMRFPVFSRAISARGTVKASVGSVNVAIICGGVTVQPGDIVVGDDDGVVVIPRVRAVQVAEAAAARQAKEQTVRTRLAAGELGLDIYGMRDALAKAGLVYLDDEKGAR